MSYNPDPHAIPSGTQFTRQLSQRDLSLQVPLNFVTVPGVVLKQACFADNRYVDGTAAKCFSNLLALGFQKFFLDIYWDQSRQVWSLCPVELGTVRSNSTLRRTASSGHNAFQGFNAAAWEQDMHPNENVDPHKLGRRQDSTSIESTTTSQSGAETTSTSLTGSSLALPGSTATSTLNTTALAPPTPTGSVVDVGPYTCSHSTSFQSFVNILLLHLTESQTNVNATMKFLIMNLNAASPASNPTGPPPDVPLGTLPQGKQALGYILDQSMTQFLYTPDDLALERTGLNSSQSWYAVDRFDEPDSAYFTVDTHNGGDAYTPNGWPSESFVEMQRAQRLLAGFGTIQPQMQQYNFSADKSIIFPSGYLESSIQINPFEGRNYCFFDAGETSVSAINNSWAQTSDQGRGSQAFAAANRYTHCGISPILNETLEDTTADKNYEPYRTFIQRTIWSWALGQPKLAFGDTDGGTQRRCAVLNANTGYWQTEDCSESHYSACSRAGRPYEWSIGAKHVSYTVAELPCPDGTIFNAPHTALENRYLLHRWRNVKTEQGIEDDFLWVNFNDLDVQGCWVIGQNVTCPYLNQGGDDRQVIVPTVAAIIVFVLAALTVFVKCAANRQRTRRRKRRGDDGWDYEGVPS